jgi:hypothetical protein
MIKLVESAWIGFDAFSEYLFANSAGSLDLQQKGQNV